MFLNQMLSLGYSKSPAGQTAGEKTSFRTVCAHEVAHLQTEMTTDDIKSAQPLAMCQILLTSAEKRENLRNK